MTFQFGEYVAVTHRLVRIRNKTCRYWEIVQLNKPEIAVFLRPVTLADGKIDWEYYDEDGKTTWFNPDKTYQGAWICRHNRKPEYALMSTIHDLSQFAGLDK